MLRTLLVAAVLASAAALAQGTEGPGSSAPAASIGDLSTPEAKAAKELLDKYLKAVKAKKWVVARAFLHPKTLDAIAERKKRLGREDHPMAPWFHEKLTSWMKDYKLTGAAEGPLGTIIVETSEDNYQVEEKGMAEGERATYLLGRQGGKWFVVDKKRGETFTKDSIKIGYKGWFDKIEKAPEEE